MEDRPPNTESTDNALVDRARQGDHHAYRVLVERHTSVAFRTAYLVTRSASDAEDAVQEAFVKAYLQLDRFDQGSPFRPWMLTIVANEARNRRRAEGRRLAYETQATRQATSGDAVPSPEAAAERDELAKQLLSAVNQLPERERFIVGLRYFLELSEAETAAVADIPRGTVKSRLARALERLRTLVGDSRG